MTAAIVRVYWLEAKFGASDTGTALGHMLVLGLGASPGGDANRGGPQGVCELQAARCCAFSHWCQKCNPSVNIRRSQES